MACDRCLSSAVAFLHAVLVGLWLTGSPAGAAPVEPDAGSIQGVVTTQGSVRLPGVEILVTDRTNRVIARVSTDVDGHYQVGDLAPGLYSIRASLAGFDATVAAVRVESRLSAEVPIELRIARVSQSVEVVGVSDAVASQGTLARTETIGGQELEQFAPGGGVHGALRLMASVLDVPGGVSIKGGLPSQAGVQLGATTLVDPSTGLTRFSLPDGAIDSVSVLANPYAVEYGRFSSGLIVIRTRRAGDAWKLRVNGLDPAFRIKRDTVFDVEGLASIAPRVDVGGPIIKDRIFLEQSAQYRYDATDVASRPQNELKTNEWFSSFTRIDALLSARHSVVATGGVFPSLSEQATLGTFTPPDATVDVHGRTTQVAVTERALWSPSLVGETTVQAHEYTTDVIPQGEAAMRLLPDTTLGNFFNRQDRRTTTYQFIEALSGSHAGPGGLHLFKAGADILRSVYEGTSDSAPILIERADTTLARRLDFSGSTRQSIGTTDVALFAQDRLQPSGGWYLEFGGRVDYDGVVARTNVTPRIGATLLLNKSGSATLRGGAGLFYERTPSTAGVFTAFESATESRFAVDGTTLLGPPVTFLHQTTDLRTSRSRTWDVAYDQRFDARWSIHAALVQRDGRDELIIDRVESASAGALVLSSTGQSTYREAEVGVHFSRGETADVNVTYRRATGRSDLNALTLYYDSVLVPVLGANQYAPSNSDVPNRLLARGRIMPTPNWRLLGIFDWRSGLPYSIVDEALDFVGPRNSLRLPVYARLELGLERRLRIKKVSPWLGARLGNALAAFLPADVQNNLGSRAFGTFYNSEYRQLRFSLRFDR